jgi:hypothetical protein
MKTLCLLAVIALTGCAFNRPNYYETTYNPTNGVTTVKRLSVPTWALWPATSSLEKQRVSVGKTMSVGTGNLEQDSGSTNLVEALKAIDSILSKLR